MGKINERCAGIDVGKRFLLCCALTGAANEEPSARTLRFDTSVVALTRLREWLVAERITHVVMESTGSYWVPIFNILENHFESQLLDFLLARPSTNLRPWLFGPRSFRQPENGSGDCATCN